MYDAWISAMQKGIGAAFHRSNTDYSFDTTLNSKVCNSTANEANGSIQNKNDKIRKVR